MSDKKKDDIDIDLSNNFAASDLGITNDDIVNAAELTIPKDQYRRILVAEDCKDTQLLLSYMLKRYGFEVCSVEDGRQCLDFASTQSEQLDVILLDIGLPIFDGYTIARRIREDGYLGPIIATTAYPLPGDEAEAKRNGCNHFLPKSELKVKLQGILREYLH